MTIREIFLSFSGRLRRRDMWVCLGALLVAGGLLWTVLVPLLGGRIASLVTWLAVAWPLLALFAKRLHDRDKAAAPWIGLYLGPGILLTVLQQAEIGFIWRSGIPRPLSLGEGILPDVLARTLPNGLSILALLVALIGVLEMLFGDETPGTNRFGRDPRVTAGAEE